MRLSFGAAAWLLLLVGSCARTEEVESARVYAQAVEAYVLEVEQRFDRRLDDLEARMDETEIYAQEACSRLNC